MKKCICVTKCFERNSEGKTRLYQVGMIDFFKTCPTHFKEMNSGYEVNFETAGKDELLESEFDLTALKDFIFDSYGKKAGNRGKEATVAMLLDCRYRHLNTEDLNKTVI